MRKQNIPKDYIFQYFKEYDFYIDYYYKDHLGIEHMYREYKEEVDEYQKMMRSIQKKREEFIEKWEFNPNRIFINKEMLILLEKEYPYIKKGIKTIAGMDILIDDSIIDSEDIKIMYSSAEECNHYDSDRKMYFSKQDVLRDINTIIEEIKQEASFDEDMNKCCDDLTSEECDDLIKSLKEIVRYLC